MVQTQDHYMQWITKVLFSPLFWTAVGAIGVFLTAVFTFKAAKATRDSAIATKISSKAFLLSQLISEYASDEMLEALREVSAWQKSFPNDFAEKYAQLRIRRVPKGDELDKYRRRISHYFTKLKIYCERGLIDKSIVKGFFLEGTFIFLRDVIQPIEIKHREIVIGTTEHRDLSSFYNDFITPE